MRGLISSVPFLGSALVMLEEGAMYRRIGIIVTAAAMGMLVAGTSAQAANTPVLAWSQGGITIPSYDFGTVDGVGGHTATQTFTLTNSGRSASAALTVTLSGSSAFSINVDGCTRTSLGPNTSCAVTVTYAPTVSGEIDNATLTAQGKKADANASIALTGQGGTPYLTLSPGTFTGTDSNGTNDYGYDFGQVGSSSVTRTFTVTNSGTGTSNTLQLAPCCNIGFTLSNDHVSGLTLAPGGTATFQLTPPSSLSCTGPGFLTTPLVMNGQSNGSPYISVTYTAFCGEVPPITSVTAGLRNSSPQFVPIGNPGAQQPIAVLGTLKNVSVGPTPLPPPSTLKCPPTCEGLHSFTIQIPFLTNAGTLYCSMGNAYQPGTCSVSNNVLTVTQNFTFPQPFRWLPGHSEQIGYVYVGASQLGEFVTWGTPTVTAAN